MIEREIWPQLLDEVRNAIHWINDINLYLVNSAIQLLTTEATVGVNTVGVINIPITISVNT